MGLIFRGLAEIGARPADENIFALDPRHYADVTLGCCAGPTPSFPARFSRFLCAVASLTLAHLTNDVMYRSCHEATPARVAARLSSRAETALVPNANGQD